MTNAPDDPLFQEFPQAKDGGSAHRPLAESMRPNLLKEVLGQEHLLGKDCLLPKLVKGNSIGN